MAHKNILYQPLLDYLLESVQNGMMNDSEKPSKSWSQIQIAEKNLKNPKNYFFIQFKDNPFTFFPATLPE